MSTDTSAMIMFILLSFICASITSFFTYKFYDLTHIIITSVLGALIASIGWCGISDKTDIEEMIEVIALLGFSDSLSIFTGTFFLSIFGFFAQFTHLIKQGKNSSKESVSVGEQIPKAATSPVLKLLQNKFVELATPSGLTELADYHMKCNTRKK